jgi:hypothetical protein
MYGAHRDANAAHPPDETTWTCDEPLSSGLRGWGPPRGSVSKRRFAQSAVPDSSIKREPSTRDSSASVKR